MRGWLERWARGRIVRRPLGAEFDRRFFYASPEAALCWALPWASAELDKGFMSFCREFYNPAMWSMILGGHLGIFAFSAAHRAGAKGAVLSVEPDPFLSRLMIRSKAECPSGVAPCTVLTCVVGRELVFAALEIPERSRAASALAGKSESTQRGGIRERLLSRWSSWRRVIPPRMSSRWILRVPNLMPLRVVRKFSPSVAP